MRKRIAINHTNNVTVEGAIEVFSTQNQQDIAAIESSLPEILFVTSYPPRECGIATYSQDLVKALNNKFNHSFSLKVCALESESEQHHYPKEVKYILNTSVPKAFVKLAKKINEDTTIQIVMIQHEFGFFDSTKDEFLLFQSLLTKPIVIVFHTVLPLPQLSLKTHVQQVASTAAAVIVMTHFSSDVLINDYDILPEKITVIPHGTHLVPHADQELLKVKYDLSGKTVLSTFGLLSSGKSIETTLEALPAIIEHNPDVLFLIIGKTHPSVVKREGEKYRQMLEHKASALHLEKHVRFINAFLPLDTLLEYLQLTDIYLFTSKDPNQAVSGTFSYAISCGCPIISTPIPHAREVLQNDAGIIIDFENAEQLTYAVNSLISDAALRKSISSNGLHRMASTAWENAAIAHAILFEGISNEHITLHYHIPVINLDHIKKMTTNFGMIQFAQINHPDIDTGYTLDDNARAMVALCQHFELTNDPADIPYISTYFNFIKFCLQPEGYFLNYVDEQFTFTEQNHATNLADSNGRAIWALGYLISVGNLLPHKLIAEAEATLQSTLDNISKIHSTRAMAFAIKGLFYANSKNGTYQNLPFIEKLANRLVQMYRHESSSEWEWFESYLTYANSILPEAMLCAWLATGNPIYKSIAKSSFDFLLSKTFRDDSIKVISNKSWLQKGEEQFPPAIGGEQPIDIAYTILALSKFYGVFKEEEYMKKMETSFNWFLGNNHLHQIIYNPCTGGCYDGLEETSVNLNQGAESTVSYLMARLTIEKSFKNSLIDSLQEEDSLQI
ncbi:glycosyltransferase [Flectobacillus major]|uniref:glycosyltransferase n=1 Tax=Flectobacillus major TaxID=103 RepID=UPI0009DB8275|nr:glycosyltransferase [Flectobacillus major]